MGRIGGHDIADPAVPGGIRLLPDPCGARPGLVPGAGGEATGLAGPGGFAAFSESKTPGTGVAGGSEEAGCGGRI